MKLNFAFQWQWAAEADVQSGVQWWGECAYRNNLHVWLQYIQCISDGDTAVLH